MENLRRYRVSTAYQYKGHIVQAIFYYKGNSDLVHSWDVIVKGTNLSKAMPDERRALGFTDDDMDKINHMISVKVAAEEGRL